MQYMVQLKRFAAVPAILYCEPLQGILKEDTSAEVQADDGTIEVVPWQVWKFDFLKKVSPLYRLREAVPTEEEKDHEIQVLGHCLCQHHTASCLTTHAENMEQFDKALQGVYLGFLASF